MTKSIARRASLTGPQLATLKLLESSDGLSLSHVSEQLRTQNSTLTGIVDRMERDGLVTRTRAKDDRRVVRLHLTRKGRDCARAVVVPPLDLFRTSVSVLTPAETRELRRLLGKVAEHVQTTVQPSFDAEENEDER